MIPRLLFLVTSVVLFTSCSGSSSNPASSGEVVVIGGDLMNHSGLSGTILKADLLFDGSVIASQSFTQASLYASLAGTLNSVKSGLTPSRSGSRTSLRVRTLMT